MVIKQIDKFFKNLFGLRLSSWQYLLAVYLLAFFFSCSSEHMPLPKKESFVNNLQLTKAPTFNTDILPLFQRTCSACHHVTSAQANLLDYDVAFLKKEAIYERVVKRQDMPMPPFSLTQEERELVKRWIKSGAPLEQPKKTVPDPQVVIPPTIETPPTSPTSAQLIADGQIYYKKYSCHTCHGEKGDAVIPPSAYAPKLTQKPRSFLGDERFTEGDSIVAIYNSITNGIIRTRTATDDDGNTYEQKYQDMPSFQSLPEEDRLALAYYIRSLNKKKTEQILPSK